MNGHDAHLLPVVRAAPAPEPMSLRLHADEHVDETYLEVVDQPARAHHASPDLEADILAALAQQPQTRAQLRATLRVRNQRLGTPPSNAWRRVVASPDSTTAGSFPFPRLHNTRNGTMPTLAPNYRSSSHRPDPWRPYVRHTPIVSRDDPPRITRAGTALSRPSALGIDSGFHLPP